MKIRKAPFTLMEVMIGLGLLLLASGLVGANMHQAIQRKRFHTELDRLKERCITCQKMALTMQADWKGVLKKHGKQWTFEMRCLDQAKVKTFPALKLDAIVLFVDGKKTDELSLEFFSTGLVIPCGTLKFQHAKNKSTLSQEWNIPEIFHGERGDRDSSGPLHPRDL